MGMCISSQLKKSYTEVIMTDLSKSGSVFSLFPIWFVYHTLLYQIIPHAVWFVLLFLRVLHSMGEELGHT